MNITEVLPSDLHLENLTELERHVIFEVLKRDMELRSKESEKIRILRSEVNDLHLCSTETEASGNQDKVCPLCHVEFGWVFNRGDLCARCQTKVCDKCRQTGTSKHKWLCTLCSKQIELKTRSGSWFYGKIRRSRRRIRDNGMPMKREDTPDPFARKKTPIAGDIVPSTDSSINSRIKAEEDFAVIKEQLLSSLSKTHVPLENVIFPKESDKKLLAELLAMKTCSSLSTEDMSSEENSLLSSKQTAVNGERIKSGDERIELSHAVDSNVSTRRSGNSLMLESSEFRREQQSRNLQASSDCERQSSDCWEKERDSSVSTDEELIAHFPPKSKAVNCQLRQSAERPVAEVSQHLDKMPVAQLSDGARSPSSPRESQSSSVWSSPSPRSTAAAVHIMVKSDGRDRSLAGSGRMIKLETVVPPSETISGQFRRDAPATKCSHKSDLNVTQNKMHEAKDEIDSRDLIQFTNKKSPRHESERNLGLNVSLKPESVENRFVIYDGDGDDDDDESLSVISEETEKEVDLISSPNIANSTDLFNSDPEDDKWHRRRGLLIKDECCFVSVTDQQELDSFISQLANEEIVLTKSSKANPSFDSITENNRKVLQLSSSQEIVRLKTEKKNADRMQPSANNEVLDRLGKNDLTNVTPKLTVAQVRTNSMESRATSFTSHADNQDNCPLSDMKTSFLLKENNDLSSSSHVGRKEGVLATGGNHLTGFAGLSKKQDSHDFLQKADSDSDIFKNSKSLRTQQKHHQSSVQSDSLSHLVSEEFALTGPSNDLEAEINASAAYNEVFLSELDENLSLSDICTKQSGNDQNAIDLSKSTMIADLHEKIDLQTVKKQLGIGAKVSNETMPPKYHSNVARKKIVLQEVLKTNENRNRVKDSVPSNSSASGTSLERRCLNESMDLNDSDHGNYSAPLVFSVMGLASKETDSETESWNVVERSVPSASCTDSEEYQTNNAVGDGKALHPVDRGRNADGLQKKTIQTELSSQNQEDSQFSDKNHKHAIVASLAGRQVMKSSNQVCRSVEEEKFPMQGSVATDQQQLCLMTESDDTDDDDRSIMLNERDIFVSERVSPQLNFADERAIDFEMVSGDDGWHDTEADMTSAKYSNVGGAFLSATSESVQFSLAPLSASTTEAEVSSQLDAELTFPRESLWSRDKVAPVLIITQHVEDDDNEHEAVANDGGAADASPNSAKVHHNSLSKQSFSSIKATSQESILSVYSNAGKSHLGKIAVTGEIELSIRYNDRSSTIDVFVRQCRGLAVVDAKKKRTDPYVKTYLLPNKSKSGKRKTAIKKNTLNPVYNEVLRYGAEEEGLERHTLWVSVWHNDRFGRNEFLGDVLIQLDSKALSDIEPQWYSLQQDAGVKWKSVLSLTSKADLDLSLKYVTADRTISKMKGKQKKPYGELLATVKMARNLSAIHGNNLSNPFCKCRILPEQLHQSKQKTRVVKHSCSPTWNHTFVFTSIALEDLEDCGLELTIWDQDRLKGHDFLGGVRLNLGSPVVRQPGKEWMDAAGDEISLWRNMMIHPNEWIEATIPLRSYMGD